MIDVLCDCTLQLCFLYKRPHPNSLFRFICLLIVLEILGIHILLTLNFGTTWMRQFYKFNLLEFSKHDRYMKHENFPNWSFYTKLLIAIFVINLYNWYLRLRCSGFETNRWCGTNSLHVLHNWLVSLDPL